MGDIGGEVGQIDIGNPVVNGIRISDSGIFAYKNSDNTFSLSATGDAFFKGTIEAASGIIGGASFNTTTVGGFGALEVTRLKVGSQLDTAGLLVTGNSVQRAILPASHNLYDLGATDPQFDLFWRDLFIRNVFYTGSLSPTSDIRLKENVSTVEQEYNDFILNTDIITYNLIKDEEKELKIGVNANAIQEAFGEKASLVVKKDPNDFYAVDYIAFIPMMIKTIQTQQSQIEELKDRLTTLENGEE